MATIETTRPNYREAQQLHITGGFIFVQVDGDPETYTIPYADAFLDGRVYIETAEAVLGGKFVNARFRFIR